MRRAFALRSWVFIDASGFVSICCFITNDKLRTKTVVSTPILNLRRHVQSRYFVCENRFVSFPITGNSALDASDISSYAIWRRGCHQLYTVLWHVLEEQRTKLRRRQQVRF